MAASAFQFDEPAGSHVAASQNSRLEADRRQATYDRRIIIVGGLVALIGFVMGFGLLLIAPQTSPDRADHADKFEELRVRRQRIRQHVGAPFVLAGFGFVAGMSVMGAIAPKEFLDSRRGRLWMNRIMTENILVARIVWGMIAVLMTAFFVLAGACLILM